MAVIGKWILQFIIKMGVRALESKFPGLTPVIEKIVAYLEGGGSTAVLQKHVELLPDSPFQATGLKK